MAGTVQINVNLLSLELTDTDRRAIAWAYRGEDLTSSALANRVDARAFLRTAAETYLRQTVERYLDAGGQTAGMEERSKS